MSISKMSRKTFQTALKGAKAGEIFTTETFVPTDLHAVRISHIIIGTDNDWVRSLDVKYAGEENNSERYGEKSGDSFRWADIALDPDEWITRIETESRGSALQHIKLVTNKGRTYGPYGKVPSSNIVVLEPAEPGFGLLWVNGYSSSSFIYSIQATFATYPAATMCGPPASLKYFSGTRSTYYKELLSPIVTLVVGTPAVSLTVHEDIVCRLPFFKAALQGNFLEASSKTIEMPEDDPAIIAAVIEYLVFGTYTYAHGYPDSNPTSDVEQALFHLNVYAAATKYDCTALQKFAMENLRFVLQTLSGIDVLKIWQAAYDCGLSIEDVENSGFHKVKLRMKEVYAANPNAMCEIVGETPNLVTDILHLMVTGG